MATNRTSPKKGKVVDIPDATITIGTPTAGSGQVSVAFTVASTPATGGPVQKYTAISSPGSFTADATTSPVVVTGLTNGTAYTIQVAAANATGRGALSSASASATPAIQTSYESIATVTVGSGGSSSISFSSIPSTFKHLQVRGISRCTKADTGSENAVMSFNSDTTYTNYYTHVMDGDGSSASATGIQVSGFYSQAALTIGNNATANAYGAAVIDILDYTNTSKNKTVRILTGIDTNGYGQVRLASSVWMSTAAINAITINPRSAGNFLQYSSFALYGIKG